MIHLVVITSIWQFAFDRLMKTGCMPFNYLPSVFELRLQVPVAMACVRCYDRKQVMTAETAFTEPVRFR